MTLDVVLRRDDGLRVSLARYPLPHDEGDPWSQWGLGTVLPDGRFVSAVGDHLATNGNSWLFELDPDTHVLTRTADVGSAIGDPVGGVGYGKVHGRLVTVDCTVHLATYWGSRGAVTSDPTWEGDHLLAYDPQDRSLTDLGVPVPGYGVPSLNGWAEGGLLYGEAVDPAHDPDRGAFFVWDVGAGRVEHVDTELDMASFRDVLVDAHGRAWVSAGDRRLHVHDPVAGTTTTSDELLPGDWLRASTAPGPDGTVYAATREPDALFALTPDGEVRDLGRARGYVAALALSPDGRFLYYVPDAHGTAWRTGTPLVRVDTRTGEDEVVVELADLGERSLGLRLGGSYDIALDATGTRVHVGLNAGAPADDDSFGDVVLAVVELPGLAADDAEAAPSGESTIPEASLAELLQGLLPHAVAAADVDDDGWTDVVVGSFADRPPADYGAGGPAADRLLVGGPNGFTVSDGLRVPLSRTSGAAFADLDGDGDQDLVLVRNVRDTEHGATPTVVLANDGAGSFTEAAVLGSPRSARHVSPFDADLDGDLDLLVTGDRFGPGATRLWRNDGDLRFVDATAASGIPSDITGLAATTSDLTGDGVGDIWVSGSTSVFVGLGDGTFDELRDAAPVWEIHGDEDDPAGVAVADVDGDGRLDVLVGQHHNSTIDDGVAAPVRLYENREEGGGLRLVDVTDQSGLVPLATKAPHVELVDVDGDAVLDVVTSARVGGRPGVQRGLGVRDGTAQFAPPVGATQPRYWVTGVVADLDRDRRPDILAVEFDHDDPGGLVRGGGGGGGGIAVDVGGPTPDGIGAVVHLHETGPDGRGRRLAAVPVTADVGYAAGRPARLLLGVGDRSRVDLVVVLPGGEEVERRDVEPGELVVVP